MGSGGERRWWHIAAFSVCVAYKSEVMYITMKTAPQTCPWYQPALRGRRAGFNDQNVTGQGHLPTLILSAFPRPQFPYYEMAEPEKASRPAFVGISLMPSMEGLSLCIVISWLVHHNCLTNTCELLDSNGSYTNYA